MGDKIEGLIRSARHGDEHSYHICLEHIYDILKKYLAPRVGNLEDREELMQDILLSLHLSLHTYDLNQQFLPWFFTLVKRRIIDYYRAYSSRNKNDAKVKENSEFNHTHEKHTDLSESEVAIHFQKIIEDLPLDVKNSFIRIALEGETYENFAEENKITYGNARIKYHRALKLVSSKLFER